VKNYILALIIIVMACPLSSCSFNHRPPKSDTLEVTTSETEAVELPSREALLVYGSGQNTPARLILTLAGGPYLLPSGYARLAGVVSGEKPIVLLEVGGRGLALGKGETVDDYRVVSITGDSVLLAKRK
jgi:hypothetical protein